MIGLMRSRREPLYQLIYVDLHVTWPGRYFGLGRLGWRCLRLGLRQVGLKWALTKRTAPRHVQVRGHIRKLILDARFLTLLFAGHLLNDLGQVDLGAELLLVVVARERAVTSHLRALAARRRRGRRRIVTPLLRELFGGTLGSSTETIIDPVLTLWTSLILVLAWLAELFADVRAHGQVVTSWLLDVLLEDVAAIAPSEVVLARVLRETIEALIVDTKIHLLGAISCEVACASQQGPFLLAQRIDLAKLVTFTVTFEVQCLILVRRWRAVS